MHPAKGDQLHSLCRTCAIQRGLIGEIISTMVCVGLRWNLAKKTNWGTLGSGLLPGFSTNKLIKKNFNTSFQSKYFIRKNVL